MFWEFYEKSSQTSATSTSSMTTWSGSNSQVQYSHFHMLFEIGVLLLDLNFVLIKASTNLLLLINKSCYFKITSFEFGNQ